MGRCERLSIVIMIPAVKSMCSFPIDGFLSYVQGSFSLSAVNILFIWWKVEGLNYAIAKGASFIGEDWVGAPIGYEGIRIEGRGCHFVIIGISISSFPQSWCSILKFANWFNFALFFADLVCPEQW